MPSMSLLASGLLAFAVPAPIDPVKPADTPLPPTNSAEQPLSLSDTLAHDALAQSQSQSTADEVSGAERRNYLRVTGGIVTTEDSDGPDEDIEFDEGYLLSLGFGHRFGAADTGLGFAMELEGLYTDQDADDTGALQALTDVTVAGPMLNGIADFRFADQFSVYGAAGIGALWMDIGTTSDGLNDFDDEDGPFLAWQLKAGLAWSFSERTALHVGYRFLNVDDAEIDDGIGGADFDLETQQHALELGLLFGI